MSAKGTSSRASPANIGPGENVPQHSKTFQRLDDVANTHTSGTSKEIRHGGLTKQPKVVTKKMAVVHLDCDGDTEMGLGGTPAVPPQNSKPTKVTVKTSMSSFTGNSAADTPSQTKDWSAAKPSGSTPDSEHTSTSGKPSSKTNGSTSRPVNFNADSSINPVEPKDIKMDVRSMVESDPRLCIGMGGKIDPSGNPHVSSPVLASLSVMLKEHHWQQSDTSSSNCNKTMAFNPPKEKENTSFSPTSLSGSGSVQKHIPVHAPSAEDKEFLKFMQKQVHEGVYLALSRNPVPIAPWARLVPELETRPCHGGFSKTHMLKCGHAIVTASIEAGQCAENCKGYVVCMDAKTRALAYDLESKVRIVQFEREAMGFAAFYEDVWEARRWGAWAENVARYGTFDCTRCKETIHAVVTGERETIPAYVEKDFGGVVVIIRSPEDTNVLKRLIRRVKTAEKHQRYEERVKAAKQKQTEQKKTRDGPPGFNPPRGPRAMHPNPHHRVGQPISTLKRKEHPVTFLHGLGKREKHEKHTSELIPLRSKNAEQATPTAPGLMKKSLPVDDDEATPALQEEALIDLFSDDDDDWPSQEDKDLDLIDLESEQEALIDQNLDSPAALSPDQMEM